MDRPISSSHQKKKTLSRWFRILLGVALVSLAFFAFRHLLKTKIEKKDFRIAQVQTGTIENTITASGTVMPAFEQQINAPVSTEIKSVLLQSGTRVNPGDVLMTLDEEFVRLQYESLKDQLELKKNNVTLLKLEYDKNLQELAYNDQIKALELSSKKALLADIRRLKDIGSATQEEVEKAELEMQIVELEKKKLENNLNFRKKAINNDRRNLELEAMIQEKKMRELQRKLQETTVVAPRAGVITWINESIGKKVEAGEPLVRLANLKHFRIEAQCSDRYSSLVKIGMPAKVRINNTRLTGIISSILPSIENNTIEFIVDLQDANNHPDLRPNMRVEVFIISDRKENVLRVANGPVFTGGREQKIFVIRGQQAIREEIRVGLSNMEHVEITDGNLRAGDQVIISDMQDYDHLTTIELKEEL